MPSHTASTEFCKFSVSQLFQLKRNYFLNHPAFSSDIPETSYKRISITKRITAKKKKSFQILKKLPRSCGVFQPIIVASV